MARVPFVGDDDIPEAGGIFGEMRSRGRLLNLYRVLGHHPAALERFVALGSAVYGRESTVTRKQAELAYTAATVANHCYY